MKTFKRFLRLWRRVCWKCKGKGAIGWGTTCPVCYGAGTIE